MDYPYILRSLVKTWKTFAICPYFTKPHSQNFKNDILLWSAKGNAGYSHQLLTILKTWPLSTLQTIADFRKRQTELIENLEEETVRRDSARKGSLPQGCSTPKDNEKENGNLYSRLNCFSPGRSRHCWFCLYTQRFSGSWQLRCSHQWAPCSSVFRAYNHNIGIWWCSNSFAFINLEIASRTRNFPILFKTIPCENWFTFHRAPCYQTAPNYQQPLGWKQEAT